MNITVPSGVTIPAGTQTISFPIWVVSTAISQSAHVTASYGGGSATVPISIYSTVPQLSTLSCAVATVSPGSSVVCQASLSLPAPSSGGILSLSSTSPGVIVPSRITIPGGAASATFNATVSSSASASQVALTAIYGALSKKFVLTVSGSPAQPALSTVSCSPSSVQAGTSSVCAASLTSTAPSGGTVVTLSTGATGVTIPSTVTIPAGISSGQFMALTAATAPAQTAVITAGTSSGTRTASLAITTAAPAPQLSSLACSPASLTAGGNSACTVSLSAAASAGGMVVGISTNAAGVTVPASVTVPAGAASAQFVLATSASGAAQTAVITATAAGVIRTASVIIAAVATPQLSTLTCSPSSITAGSSAVCTLSLSSAAPASGFAVSISENGTGITVPGSVSVPANASSVQFQAATTSSAPSQTVTIVALAGTTSKSAILTIAASGTSYQITSFSCTPSEITPGASANCRVRFTPEAPAGGLVANLSSSSSNVSVPAVYNILPTAGVFQFSATASNSTPDLETATLKVSIQTQTSTTTLTVNPYPPFYLSGNTTEINSMANGATVYPSAAPAGITGKLIVKGAGYVSFAPVASNNGVTFHAGGSQTTNTSFIDFTGSELGTLFDDQGEISLLLKSGFSFAERKSQPESARRYAYEVYDDATSQFLLSTYVTNGRLVFAYETRGVISYYMVPAGQEDQIFGRGVVAKIRIKWSPGSNELYINDGKVYGSTYMTRAANWSSRSTLTVGAHTSRVAPGGNYASDDAIAELKVF